MPLKISLAGSLLKICLFGLNDGIFTGSNKPLHDKIYFASADFHKLLIVLPVG